MNEQQQSLQWQQGEVVTSLNWGRDRGSVSQFAVSSHTMRSSRIRPDDAWPPPNSQYTTPASSPSQSPASADASFVPQGPRAPSPDLQEDILSLNVKKTFSRAANVIREYIEVEGGIFLMPALTHLAVLSGTVKGKTNRIQPILNQLHQVLKMAGHQAAIRTTEFKGQPLQHRRVETVGLGILSFIYF